MMARREAAGSREKKASSAVDKSQKETPTRVVKKERNESPAGSVKKERNETPSVRSTKKELGGTPGVSVKKERIESPVGTMEMERKEAATTKKTRKESGTPKKEQSCSPGDKSKAFPVKADERNVHDNTEQIEGAEEALEEFVEEDLDLNPPHKDLDIRKQVKD